MTNLTQAPETYLDDEKALSTLADALQRGQLVLFLGAGVSKAASRKIPTWVDLVTECCQKKNVSFDANKAASNTYLRKRIEEVERKCSEEEYLALVENALYGNVKYDISLMKTDLFVALGSLVMNSLRGAAGAVVTYNFDDLLEWYLCYHGVRVEIVSKFPALSSRADVRVLHPHGFLPRLERFRGRRTNEIVFSQQKYEAEMTSQVSPRNEAQRALLGCNVGLFVGLSGEDPHISSLCEKVYNGIIRKERIIGFQLFVDESNEVESDEEQRERTDYNLARGIVSLHVEKYEDVPEFLLSICRRAAEL